MELFIDNIKGVEKIELYNMLGQLIEDIKINNSNEINIPYAKNGIYNVVVYKTNGIREYTKVVVNR